MSAAAAHPIGLMIIEDQPVIRFALERIATDDARFAVLAVASDGLDAYERLGEVRPDAVLCDIRMPRMNGLELLPHLRRQWPNAVIAMYTADPTDDTKDVCLHLGADLWLRKGHPEDEPFAALAHAVTSQGDRRE